MTPNSCSPWRSRLTELGIRVLTDAKAMGLSDAAMDAARRNARRRAASRCPPTRILVTVGRRPRTEGWGLEELDLDRAGRFIRIDERCRTSMRGIYAIGDVTGEPMLAHRADGAGRDGRGDRRRPQAFAGTSAPFPPSALPIRRSSRPASRRTKPAPRATRSGSASSPSTPTAGR